MSLSSPTAVSPAPHRLSWPEICARFPDRWVILVDTAWRSETDFDFASAIVVAAHRQRRAASADIKAAAQSHAEVGCYWTGAIRGHDARVWAP